MPRETSISGLLLLEAAVAGIPATFLLAVFGQWTIVVSMGEWRDSVWFALAIAALAIMGAFALGQYWTLAIRTAKGVAHPTGRMFWLSVIAGVVTNISLWAFMWPVGFICLWPGLAALHFLQVQRSINTTRVESNAA